MTVLFFAGLVAALRLVVVSDQFGIEDSSWSVLSIAVGLGSLSVSGFATGVTLLGVAPRASFVVAVGGLAFAFGTSAIVGLFVGITVARPTGGGTTDTRAFDEVPVRFVGPITPTRRETTDKKASHAETANGPQTGTETLSRTTDKKCLDNGEENS